MISDERTDGEIIDAWYKYAAERPGFVGEALRFLRGRLRLTVEQQEEEFGTTDSEFLHLQAMPLPRAKSFANDAQRIAETCQLGNPLAFVRAMLLVRDLRRRQPQDAPTQAYEAAFDVSTELDELPDTE